MRKILRNLGAFLSGKKTYVCAFVLAVYAVAGYAVGELELPVAGVHLFEALAVAGLRAGIAKQ
jgi:hypothetical protein